MKTDNEIIAEFMKCSKPPNTDFDYFWRGEFFKSHNAKWNTSWDWLMPVVEKIAKIETNDKVYNGEDSYFDSYFPRTFAMINCETREFMVRLNRNPLHQSTSLIEATYKAVVEFIKWYNQQTK